MMWFVHKKNIAAITGNYHRFWQPWIVQVGAEVAAVDVNPLFMNVILSNLKGGTQPGRGGMLT